jgi:hypothetical protein
MSNGVHRSIGESPKHYNLFQASSRKIDVVLASLANQQIKANWSGERFRKSGRLFEAFKAAVEAEEMTEFQNGSLRAHG